VGNLEMGKFYLHYAIFPETPSNKEATVQQ
jgi:hypothetical protein